MARILIVDDHIMFATALDHLLRSLDPSINTVAVNSVGEAIKHVQETKFDLVLMDLKMPQQDGFEGLIGLKKISDDVKVAFLSGTSNPTYVRRAHGLGAVGWIPKDLSGENLLNILKLLLSGQRFFSADADDAELNVGFSEREADVAELLATGISDKEISEILDIQPGTVKVHVKRILKKTACSNRTKFALLVHAQLSK